MALYEVTSNNTFVLSKPSFFSNYIGTLNKGTQIDVKSISNGWANFNFKGQDAYVRSSNLKIVQVSKGSITINYIDSETSKSIATPLTNSGLSLGTYSYNAISISGYTALDPKTQSITLTSANANQIITFKYKKIVASVTIKYVDTDTLVEIASASIISNLSPVTYIYNAPAISGYTILEPTSQSVTLTETNPSQTITFKYKKIFGSVTIKYTDSLTNSEISPSKTINNLTLGSYSYDAIVIDGYTLTSESPKSITLTEDTLNQTLIFNYKKIILGSITVKYIDMATNTEIAPSKIDSNLNLGSYTYTAINIDGYTLSGDSSKTITLTESDPNMTISFNYNKITGSITIKYIDDTTLKDISTATVIRNLSIGTYSYNAIAVNGYTAIDPKTQSVTLTSASPNQTITFKYSQVMGSVTIKYIDESSLAEISVAKNIPNLPLGSYSYDAITISGYDLITSTPQSVTLSADNLNQIITFKYKKQVVVTPDDININEVPYISTYYIKPVVKPGEEVKIDYYITDYYHKEYLEEDYSEIFTVTVRIDGQADKVIPNLKAGDQTVSLGSFTKEGEQKFSILCTDKYGRNSHELFNFFLVRNDVVVKEYVMTTADLTTYNIKNTDTYEVKNIVNLSSLPTKDSASVTAALQAAANNITPASKTYVCIIADTDGDGTPNNWWKENQVKYASNYDKAAVLQEATNTRMGLQKLLDDKQADGFNRVRLLPGTYRIDHVNPIYIPSNLTVDLNSSIIKLNQFQGENTLMIDLNDTYDSHLINGIIEGDYFSHIYDSHDEQNHGVGIYNNSKFSTIENMVIKDIVGYGAVNGFNNGRNNSGSVLFSTLSISSNFTLYDINRNSGLNISSNNRTTSDFIDISVCINSSYIVISRFLGYQGNSCGTWNLICHFYDLNKKYIKSIDSYQYRIVGIPQNSKYIRITILNANPDTTGLTINLIKGPKHCSFRNITFQNVRCVGYSPFKMNDMLAENLQFINCGQTKAISDIDCEDGWDMMQDSSFRKINSQNYNGSGFVAFGGHNLIVENMIDGNIGFSSDARSNSYVIRNCKNIKNLSLSYSNRFRTGYPRFYNNTCINGIGLSESTNSDMKLVIKDCLINGRAQANTLNKSLFLRCEITQSLTSTDSYSNSLGTGTFKDCYIHNKKGNHNYNGDYYNCILDTISGYMLRGFNFYNCKISNFSAQNVVNDENYYFNFYSCNLVNCNLETMYWSGAKYFKVLFDSCTISNQDFILRLPHYSMLSPIIFKNNTITSSGVNGLIVFNDDRTGGNYGVIGLKQDILTLDANTITLNNSKYIITGLTQSTVNNINIVSKTNILSPLSLLLCNPSARSCPNISITE